MLTYLEAVRYKTAASLSALDSRPPAAHPLAAHIRVLRDKQGLQQSILKVTVSSIQNYTTVNDNYLYTSEVSSLHMRPVPSRCRRGYRRTIKTK